MSNPDYAAMVEQFEEQNLTLPSVFERFASSVIQKPGNSLWRIGQPPAAWPFDPPGESSPASSSIAGPFTNFVSVGFSLSEPWDDVDDSYGDVEIELRLVTRKLLLELRISAGHRVLKDGGNSWGASLDSEWVPFWNEVMRDLALFATKFDLFAQFDDLTAEFTPEFALSFDAVRDQTTSFAFENGVHNALRSTYVDGPPTLESLLWEVIDERGADGDLDGDDFITFLDSNGLDEPPYFADYFRFIQRDAQGLGWRLPGGPEITAMDDYSQFSFGTVFENPLSPQLALSHAGQGTNSYGLNLRMQVGPVLIVAQYGWGGIYMDTAEQRAAWNAGMDALHEFFNEIDLNVDIFAPPEPRDLEVAIRYSQFRGSTAKVRSESGEWVDVDLSNCRHLQDVLDVVLEHQTDTWGLF